MQRRDLFVSTFGPKLGNGRDLRTYTVIRALAANAPLDLLYVAHGGGPSREFTEMEGLTLHEVVPSRGINRLGEAAIRRMQGWTTGIARSCSTEVREAAEALAAQPGRGRVIAGDLNAMAMLMRMARHRPVVYNAHNIESDYTEHPNVGRFRWPPIASLERRVLGAAAESWMVSRRDVAMALALAPGAPVRYVPNAVDVVAIRPQVPGTSPVALMVADYTYFPNRAAVEWLLEAVMPLVWQRRPDARIRLAGRGLTLAGVDERVEITGFVEDLRDAYAGAAAVVVPLVHGAGSPLKFVEALAYGVPVVATPLAARGLAVVPGRDFREGPTAEAFANNVVELFEVGDADMAGSARRLAEEEYSVEALARLLVTGAPLAGDLTARTG